MKKTKTVYAYLIENGKDAEEIRYRGWGDWGPIWEADPYKALWFVRREDAERVSAEDEDAWRIIQHGFEVPDDPEEVSYIRVGL